MASLNAKISKLEKEKISMQEDNQRLQQKVLQTRENSEGEIEEPNGTSVKQ